MKVKFNDGSRSRGSAAAIKKELDRIEARDGALMPAAIVKEAKSPKSPLHPCFDWSDRVAAHRWRLMQATQLILSVRIEGDTSDHRVYVNIGYGKGFASVTRVRDDINLSEEVLRTAKAEIDEWIRRYQDLKEQLTILTEAIESAKKRRKGAA